MLFAMAAKNPTKQAMVARAYNKNTLWCCQDPSCILTYISFSDPLKSPVIKFTNRSPFSMVSRVKSWSDNSPKNALGFVSGLR